MIVFNSLDEIHNIEPTVVALGNFDGVHKGHQEIISRTVNEAKSAGLKSAVFTFSNHTSTLLKHIPAVKNILYVEQKIKIIESMGVDYMFNIPFTHEILGMSPEDFIQQILIDKFKIREAYCGFNYTFGYKAQGTPELLMREGIKKGFGIHVQEPFIIDDTVVSSTFIRGLIAEGKMEAVTKFMGRNYDIDGIVQEGNKLGRTIGFPTCNITIDNTMITPPNGVYVTMCTYDGKSYPAITNVGNKPTIGDYEKNIETHIFNFDQEIYGKPISVEFIKHTRPEQKFNSVEELKNRIAQDCIEAKAYHRKTGLL